jgi:glycosyltransferase involved in cell wall biosynthesis
LRELPFVSVIVPTRNRARLAKETLDSLLAQDYPAERYEIIVVDDGSTDNTADVLRVFADSGNDPSVKYVRRDAMSANAARNEGIRVSTGDPIVFVDDDIEAPAGWLQALVEATVGNPDAGCVGGRIRLRLEGKPPRLCGREPFGETELDLGDEEVEARAVWSANMAVPRAAFDKVGLFNETLRIAGDEEEWEVRLAAAGGRIVYTPHAWLWHRRTQDDIRFWRLLRVRFRRGRAQARFAHMTGHSYRIGTQVQAITRSLAHAARRFCCGGLLAASIQAGRVWGLIKDQPASRKSSEAAG